MIAMKGVYKDPVKADEVAEAAGADHAVVSFAKPTGYYRVDLTNRNVGTFRRHTAFCATLTIR